MTSDLPNGSSSQLPWWQADRLTLVQNLLITLGHLLLLWWALQLVTPESDISLMWLPDGYLCGCLVLLPLRRWPWLLAMIAGSTFCVEFLVIDRPPGVILWFLQINLIESIAAALLFRHFAGGREGFRTFAQLSAFIGLCALLVPALTSVLSAHAAVDAGIASDFSAVYLHWFSAAVLGILIVAPLTIEVARWWQDGGFGHWRDELTLLATLVVVAMIVIVASWLSVMAAVDGHLSMLLSFPVLGWAAVHFGRCGGISAAAVLVVLSVQFSAFGVGPFSTMSQDATEAVVQLKIHLAVVVLATLFVSVAVERLRQSSEALHAASSRFRALFDHSPVSLWEEDFSAVKAHLDDLRRNGVADIAAWLRQHPDEVARCAEKVKILAVNKRTLSMFAAPSQAHLLASLKDIFDAQSLEAFCEEIIALDQGASEFRVVAPQLRITGERFQSITGVVVEPDYQQDWRRVQVAVEDLSAQHRVEQELAQNMSMLEELFNTLAAGVVVHAPDTEIILSNHSADALLGLTHDEILGRTAFDPHWRFLDHEGQPLAVEDFPVNQILQRAQPLSHFILAVERPNSDDLVWLLVNGAPIFDAEGQVSRVLVSFLDITELRRAEQRLRESSTVFASTSEGVAITGLDGTIRDVNDAFCIITGYTRDEVLGRNPRILKSGRHDRTFYRQLWRALIKTGQWRGEIWNRRKNGTIYPELLTISAVRDSDGKATGYVSVFSDISSLKQSEELLHHLAHHDPLTGLPNRLLLLDRLEQSIKHAARQRTLLAVGCLDLDRFKHVNDSLGHDIGDELLQLIAARLIETMRGSDTIARIGGDEFLILLDDLTDADEAAMAIEKLMKVFAQPFSIGGHAVYMTTSIGLSLYPSDGQEPATLLRNADAAMYRAKDEGRNTYQFYSNELTQAAFEHLFLESALRTALAAGELYLVYQPQVNLANETLTGLEALLRWRHPQQGMISPARFIPIAEQSGLIRDIGPWVLETACRQGRAWLDQGLTFGRIAVNVAGPQLVDEHFCQLVEQILEKTGLPPRHLALEVTESFVMRRLGVSIDHLNALRASGIEIAIDDFGTGYSSLSYLKKLPIDKLKIDGSFVRDIPEDGNDMAITEAIIALARALNMKVIAEGVETEVQAEFLRTRGCPEAQGYLYSKPLVVEDILAQGFVK